jgi:hypothetical protein
MSHFGGMGGAAHFGGARFAAAPFAHAGFAHAGFAHPRFAHAAFSPRFSRFAFHDRFHHRFHNRFHRFAFFGGGYYDYADYGGCWRQAWTSYGFQWVNVCGDYGY